MDIVLNAVYSLAALAITAVGGVLVAAAKRWMENMTAQAEAATQIAIHTVQQRLSEAAGRASAELAVTAGADRVVDVEDIALKAAALQQVFSETLTNYNLPGATIQRLMRGELAKMGVSVRGAE